MKKTYIQPDVKVVKIETQQMMLTTSIPFSEGSEDNGNALAPGFLDFPSEEY